MTVIWRGDDLGAWHDKEVVSADRIQVVDVQRGGKSVKAFRFIVRKTDYPTGSGTSGPRSELVRDDHRPEGTERYCSFSVMFPKGYFITAAGAWQVFHQYHQGYPKPDQTIGSSPPVELAINGDKLQLNVNPPSNSPWKSPTLWTAPLELDKWYDFILHAKWSPDPKVGFVHLYLNGVEVLPKTPAMTMFANAELGNVGVYMKAGLYRKASIGPDSMLYQNGYIETTTLEEALKTPAVEPPVIVPPAPAPADVGWRVGRQLGVTIYKDGKYVATMVNGDKAMAQKIVDAMNKGA